MGSVFVAANSEVSACFLAAKVFEGQNGIQNRASEARKVKSIWGTKWIFNMVVEPQWGPQPS